MKGENEKKNYLHQFKWSCGFPAKQNEEKERKRKRERENKKPTPNLVTKQSHSSPTHPQNPKRQQIDM